MLVDLAGDLLEFLGLRFQVCGKSGFQVGCIQPILQVLGEFNESREFAFKFSEVGAGLLPGGSLSGGLFR